MNAEVIRMLIAKLPVLDLTWPDHVQAAWWMAFERVFRTASTMQPPDSKDWRYRDAKVEDIWTLSVESAAGETIVGWYEDAISAVEAAIKRANTTGRPVKVQHVRQYTDKTVIRSQTVFPAQEARGDG